jgi:bile acid:Na+ symporter, BASS family
MQSSSFLTTTLLPVALGVIMLGLGLSLTLADFRRVVIYPRAVIVGLACQMLALPAVCFFICKVVGLPPELAVGMMLLAASPGGATANLYSHLAKGDVALNITLTAINSVLSLITLPLIVGFAMASFLGQERSIPVQLDKVVQVFAVVLTPVGLGMLIRARRSALAERLERPVRLVSAIFLLLVVIAAIVKERANILTYVEQVGLAALLFNLVSMLGGYFLPRLARLPVRQAVAIGMEIGIHNSTLAIAVAGTVLGSSVMAIPAAVYSTIMFFSAAAFGWFISRRIGAEAPAGEDAPPAGPRRAAGE